MWLDFENDGSNAVALTKPKDEEKFETLVEKGNRSDTSGSDLVIDKVGDWTVLSDTQAKIDRFASQAGGAKLADDEVFNDAMAELPDDTLVKVFAKGKSILGLVREFHGIGPAQAQPAEMADYVAAGLAAEGEGLRLVVASKTPEQLEGTSFASTFADRVPGDALPFATFSGEGQLAQLRSEPTYRHGLRQLKLMPGIHLGSLLDVFKDETALYVRPQAADSRVHPGR